MLTTVLSLDHDKSFPRVRAALGKKNHPDFDALLDAVAERALRVRLMPAIEEENVHGLSEGALKAATMSEKVELVKLWYKIPTPEQTRDNGYYVAEELLERAGHEKVSYTARCEREVMGQLPNFIRARDGLPLLPEGVYKPWNKNKKLGWDTRHERAARKAARERAKRAKGDR